jgi:hypothetical protein
MPANVVREFAPVEVGHQLWFELVEIANLKEQDVNAHVMPQAKLSRLTDNIRQRGLMESVPYCAQPDPSKPIEIVSGHHRVRAARAAGLTVIPALVDRSPMTRSQITAKQLAHNALVGHDDDETVQRLLASLTSVDDLLSTGLGADYLPTPDRFKVTLFTPHADYKWKFVTFTFLPHQLEQAKELIAAIGSKTDTLLVADLPQFDDFLTAVAAFARSKEILSASTAVAVLIDTALKEIERGRTTEAGTPVVPHRINGHVDGAVS